MSEPAEHAPAAVTSAALHRRVIVASTIGNAFEWFDFTLFGLFTLVIAREFFPVSSHTGSLLLGTATLGAAFFFRPIGGIVFGVYADRLGRKRALAVMVLLMAAATACLGLIPGYQRIGMLAPLLVVLARILQGFSAGGEFSSATALLVEYAPAGHKGFDGSFQMCSQSLAVTLAGLSVYTLSNWLSPGHLQSWGWRLPFLLGILVGPVGFYIRQRLQESPAFATYLQHHPKADAAALGNGLVRARTSLVSGFGLTVSATAAFYVTFIYMPIFAVRQLHLTLAQAALPTMLCGLMLTLLCPLTGLWSDLWGRKRMLVSAMLAYALVSLVLTAWVLRAPGFGNYLLLQCAATICIAFLWGPFPTAVTEAVPMGVRATGVALVYNLSVMLFGGLAPFFITAIIGLTGNAMAPALYVSGAVLLSLITYGVLGVKIRPLRPGAAADQTLR
ncbi:MAG: MFS transporter [Gammaproteobacteria bacterium]|nr:MFS transporter [Gammaproteobacteria bacterium]